MTHLKSEEPDTSAATTLPCAVKGVADWADDGRGEDAFRSPEEALAATLQDEELTASLEEYATVEGQGEGVNFQYRVNGEVHHTFEFVQSPEGEWLLRARTGCLPESRGPG